MRVRFILMSLVTLLFFTTYVYAEEGHGHHESKGSMMGHSAEGTTASVEAGNKVCPLSGEEIGAMGPAVQYEYDGKLYNFCCAGCIEKFNEDPEKYINIIEGQHHVEAEEHPGNHMETVKESEQQGQNNIVMGPANDELIIKQNEEPVSAGSVKEVNLEAYKFGFLPEKIIVSKGTIVKIHATSRDVTHGVFIKEYGINEQIKKGKITDIEFVADKPGEFDILCSVYCGRGHKKMKAKLIVEE